jgi:hypothetical protein
LQYALSAKPWQAEYSTVGSGCVVAVEKEDGNERAAVQMAAAI